MCIYIFIYLFIYLLRDNIKGVDPAGVGGGGWGHA